jgi:hypothetical protein
VTLKTTAIDPQHPQAVIPVEVRNPTGKSVKRSATVPVTLRQNSRKHKKSHARSMRSHAAQSHNRKNIRHHAKQQQQRSSRTDLVTRGLVAVTTAEEAAVNLAGQVSLSVLTTIPKWLRLGLSVPFGLAEETAERVEEAYSEGSEVVKELAA